MAPGGGQRVWGVLIRNIQTLTSQTLGKEGLGGTAPVAGGDRALVLIPKSVCTGGTQGALEVFGGCCITYEAADGRVIQGTDWRLGSSGISRFCSILINALYLSCN